MPPAAWSEGELVKAICGGNKEAIEFLMFDLCGWRLNRLSREFHYELDDLRQDLYLHLLGKEADWRALRIWEGRSSLKTWVCVIAYRLCLSRYRKNVKDRPTVQRLSDWDGMPSVESARVQNGAIDRGFQTSELLHAVDSVLKDDEKFIVLSHCLGDLSIEEVASILETTKGNVSVKKHRAIDRLREWFERGEGNV